MTHNQQLICILLLFSLYITRSILCVLLIAIGRCLPDIWINCSPLAAVITKMFESMGTLESR